MPDDFGEARGVEEEIERRQGDIGAAHRRRRDVQPASPIHGGEGAETDEAEHRLPNCREIEEEEEERRK